MLKNYSYETRGKNCTTVATRMRKRTYGLSGLEGLNPRQAAILAIDNTQHSTIVFSTGTTNTLSRALPSEESPDHSKQLAEIIEFKTGLTFLILISLFIIAFFLTFYLKILYGFQFYYIFIPLFALNLLLFLAHTFIYSLK